MPFTEKGLKIDGSLGGKPFHAKARQRTFLSPTGRVILSLSLVGGVGTWLATHGPDGQTTDPNASTSKTPGISTPGPVRTEPSVTGDGTEPTTAAPITRRSPTACPPGKDSGNKTEIDCGPDLVTVTWLADGKYNLRVSNDLRESRADNVPGNQIATVSDPNGKDCDFFFEPVSRIASTDC